MTHSTSDTGAADRKGAARLPPRWFIRLFWAVHRRVVRWTGARLGLWRPKPGRWGALRLTTVGRRSGRPRAVILGYFEDGPDLVTMAMNGWGAPEPAWWLNLQAHPDATVDVVGGSRAVTARAAEGDERDRLWARWQEIDKDLDAYAARRPHPTAVVVFEPRSPASSPPPVHAPLPRPTRRRSSRRSWRDVACGDEHASRPTPLGPRPVGAPGVWRTRR